MFELRSLNTHQEDSRMRQSRNAQASIFDFYAAHELGDQLKTLSDILDNEPGILALVDKDLRAPNTASTGACGLSVESIFRCLLLKQITGVSYEMLAFHLCDSARPLTAALRA